MARFDPFSSDFEHPFVNSSPDYGPQRGSAQPRPIGNVSTPSVSQVLSFQDRRNQLRDIDDTKNQLIDDLLVQLEATQQQLSHLELLHSQETLVNSNAKDLETQLRQIETIINRVPFVTVLLDGNQFVFAEDLMRQGNVGGKRAAERLHQILRDFVVQRMPDIEVPTIKLHMYADFMSLKSKLMVMGVVAKAATFEDFVQGFNGSGHLFDLVDIGPGQVNTERKLIDHLRLSLHNCHCRHIIVGGFESNTYSDSLQELTQDSNALAEISIIQCDTPSEEVATWKKKLLICRVDDTLRSSANAKPSLKLTTAASAIAAPVLARIESSSTAGLRTPPASTVTTPQMTWAGLAAQPMIATATPSATGSSAIKSTLPVKKASATNVIEYNRSNQRIDKQDTTIPYHDITRIKKLKLCNIYYLQDPMSCVTNGCNHRHDYPITNFERKVLREVARMTPCYYKTACDDPECIYGHRCPQNKSDSDGCYYGEDCRFWGWGHGIDTRVVKMTKV